MWIFLNDAFLSIVSAGPDLLLMRSRIKGDIERVFPRAKVQSTPERDYAYRAEVSRAVVGARMSLSARDIRHLNFKDSVRDPAAA